MTIYEWKCDINIAVWVSYYYNTDQFLFGLFRQSECVKTTRIKLFYIVSEFFTSFTLLVSYSGKKLVYFLFQRKQLFLCLLHTSRIRCFLIKNFMIFIISLKKCWIQETCSYKKNTRSGNSSNKQIGDLEIGMLRWMLICSSWSQRIWLNFI